MHTRTTPLPMPAAGDSPPHIQPGGSSDQTATRLEGFALIVTLGDRERAASVTADAWTAAVQDTADEVNPAELRRRILRALRSRRSHAASPTDAARRDALEQLRVSDAAFAGLAALNHRQRAAIVAAWVEHSSREDLATILELDGERLERFVAQAGRRYLKVAGAADALSAAEPGPARSKVRAVRERLFAE
jgi:hypothetical protein